jgi:hypothetical protein
MRASLVTRSLVVLVVSACRAFGADVIVVNGDPPGVGFNDPTPATPIGGNTGTTVGQQALNVFRYAAAQWGARLVSTQPIHALSFFLPLPCNATSGVLGAAGPYFLFANVPAATGGKALDANTWYPAALAEKITRQDIIVSPDEPFEIIAFFNSELGKPGCLTAGGWYYGLDAQEPAGRFDLAAVVLHEFGHGMGFLSDPTNTQTGARALGFPSVWERFMLDTSSGKLWLNMTDAERAASAVNNWNLVWAGQKASNSVHSTLDQRTNVEVLAPSASAADYEAQTAEFGPQLKGRDQNYLVAAVDAGGLSPTDGCEPLAATPPVAGRFVLLDRGNCTFAQKVKNAQNAGASGVVIANNVPVGLPTMSGADPTIVIPSVGVTQSAGIALRSIAGIGYVSLQLDPPNRAGTTNNLPRLYAPPVLQPGSSVSHWDVTATPNLLMEPFINSNLTHKLKNPDDLTQRLLNDIGW